MSEPTNDDGWIVHDGGPCPVPMDAVVPVRHRDGDVSSYMRAGFWAAGHDYWRWQGPEDCNIVAYKVLRLPEPDPRDARIAELTAERDALAAQVAMLRLSLQTTRSIVSAGAMEGFNPTKGGWAERLFENNGAITFALDATAPRPAPVIVEE